MTDRFITRKWLLNSETFADEFLKQEPFPQDLSAAQIVIDLSTIINSLLDLKKGEIIRLEKRQRELIALVVAKPEQFWTSALMRLLFSTFLVSVAALFVRQFFRELAIYRDIDHAVMQERLDGKLSLGPSGEVDDLKFDAVLDKIVRAAKDIRS